MAGTAVARKTHIWPQYQIETFRRAPQRPISPAKSNTPDAGSGMGGAATVTCWRIETSLRWVKASVMKKDTPDPEAVAGGTFIGRQSTTRFKVGDCQSLEKQSAIISGKAVADCGPGRTFVEDLGKRNEV